MDTKKVLQLLVKIADKQQKIINKMAQQNTDLVVHDKPAGGGTGQQPPPQNLDPAKQTHTDPAQVLLAALPPNVKGTVNSIRVQGPDMHVQFQPGKANQAAYNAIMKTLQSLTNQRAIEHAYNLKAT